MKIALKHVKPNPFRNIDRYPINREKVEALKDSISSTTFWDNIVGRRCPDNTVEIAYGHHRITALRELYDEDHEIDIIVRELDDEAMLKIMVKENAIEWGASATVNNETVRAVVEAYAAGKINLDPPEDKAPLSEVRFAPSFARPDPDTIIQKFEGVACARLQHGDPQKPYTARSVKRFLDWSIDKARDVLNALELIEQGAAKEEHFIGIKPTQARVLVQEVRKARQSRLLKAAGMPKPIIPPPPAEIIAKGEKEIQRLTAKLEQAQMELSALGDVSDDNKLAHRLRIRIESCLTGILCAKEDTESSLKRGIVVNHRAADQVDRAQKDARLIAAKLAKGFREDRITSRTAHWVAQCSRTVDPIRKGAVNNRASELICSLDKILQSGRCDDQSAAFILHNIGLLNRGYRDQIYEALVKLQERVGVLIERFVPKCQVVCSSETAEVVSETVEVCALLGQ